MVRLSSLEIGHIFVFSLVGFNLIVLYMNFAAVSKQQGFRKLQINVWKLGNVVDGGKVPRREKGKYAIRLNETRGKNKTAVKWSDIENKHRAIPAQNKMRATLANLRDYLPKFRRQVELLHMEDDMFRYKSVTNEGDVEKLTNIITDVILTNRTIHIGVIGGAQSSSGGGLCEVEKCLYFELVADWLRDVLGVDVVLHNAAMPLASSAYFSWCLNPHLDASEMDIILWELAVEDFVFKDLLTKQKRYSNPGQPQEELTRKLMSLPNAPYIIFMNFLSVDNMVDRDCLNSERFAGRVLARHYNITSISWGTAVCSRILRRPGFMAGDLIHGDHLLSRTAHHQASLFLINFLKKKIERVAFTELDKVQTDVEYVKRLIDLYDVFVENSNSTKKTTETRLSRIRSNNVLQSIFPAPLWEADWLIEPHCWPASNPQFLPGSKLYFKKNGGWETIFSDRENWYTSTGSTQILEFPFQIEKKRNHTAIVSIVTVVCSYCGQALVFLDGDVKKSKLLYGTWSKHAFRVDEIFENVSIGNHTLFISSLEEKPYKLTAVMVGYRILHEDETKQEKLKVEGDKNLTKIEQYRKN